MASLTLGFLILFAGLSALLVAVSVPLMRGWVKPNPLYGLRTRRTLADERVWYESNAYAGRLLFRAGWVQLAAVIGLYFVPSLRADFVAYNLVCGAVIVGGLLLAAALALRHVSTVGR